MINRLRLDKYSALYLWAFFMVLFTILRPDTFLTTTSFKLVTQENVINGVLALAFLIPLATGTYDLSIGLNMSACLVVINWIAKNTDLPQGVGLLLGLGVCLLNEYLASGREDDSARKQAVDLFRRSLRINSRQPKIVELLSRFG